MSERRVRVPLTETQASLLLDILGLQDSEDEDVLEVFEIVDDELREARDRWAKEDKGKETTAR